MAAEKAQVKATDHHNVEDSAAEAEARISRAIDHARPDERGRMLRGMIASAVKRLTSIVEEETVALRSGMAQADFRTFNSRKSLGLIELNRALQLLKGAPPDPPTMRLIETLNAKLEANRKVLKLQMEAVSEVASLISESIREAESDGTYSHTIRSKDPT